MTGVQSALKGDRDCAAAAAQRALPGEDGGRGSPGTQTQLCGLHTVIGVTSGG